MAMIHSVGTAVPEQQLTQEDAKKFISSFVSDRRLRRFLNVFDQADISKRHFVVHPSFFSNKDGFGNETNYMKNMAFNLLLKLLKNASTINMKCRYRILMPSSPSIAPGY